MSNSQKIYGFLIACVVLVLGAFVFAFRPTLNLHSQKKDLTEKLELNDNIDSEIDRLTTLLEPLKKKGALVNWEIYNHYSLAEITKSTQNNKVRIIEFKPHLFQDFEEYRTHLFTIDLEGPYIRLTKTLKELESKTDLGEIISTKYYRYKDRKTKKESIRLLIYLQYLESKDITDEKR